MTMENSSQSKALKEAKFYLDLKELYALIEEVKIELDGKQAS